MSKNSYKLAGDGPLLFDGKRYEPGATIQVEKDRVANLIESGRLTEVNVEPPKKPAAKKPADKKAPAKDGPPADATDDEKKDANN